MGLRDSKRQRFSKVYTNAVGQDIKATPYMTVPPPDASDLYVITVIGDRLDKMAKQYYGNQHYWWYIALVNDLDTLTVDAGIKLRIPKTGPSVR